MGRYSGIEVLFAGDAKDYFLNFSGELKKHGFKVWQINDCNQADELLKEKYFSVVVIDADFSKENKGVDFVNSAKEASPSSFVIVCTDQKISPKRVVAAYNNGCDEFVLTEKVEANYLSARILHFASRLRYRDERDTLLQNVSSIHNKFFKNLMSLHIKVMDLEEHLSPSSVESDYVDFGILVVGDQGLGAAMKRVFPEKTGWRIEQTDLGSEVLSNIDSFKVSFALVNATLADLPGSTIANALKTNFPECHCYTFDGFSGDKSAFTVYEISSLGTRAKDGRFTADDAKPVDLRKTRYEFADVSGLYNYIFQYRNEVAVANRKKHYAQTFKAQHFDFINEYTKVRDRIEKLFSFGKF